MVAEEHMMLAILKQAINKIITPTICRERKL